MQKDVLYENVIRPLLFQMDAEQAHDLVQGTLQSLGGLLSALPYRYPGADLKVVVAGHTLANPIGLAAGFDKNALLIERLGALGFGFAEIGSITGRASPGNPRPRLFRLPDDSALINRLGLNGDGADVVAQRLKSSRASLPLAVNIAKTNDPSIAGDAAVADILHSFDAVKDLDLIYIAFNASCPNTREGCMQEKKELSTVMAEIQKTNLRRLPLFIKVSPDSSEQLIDDILEIGVTAGLSGFVCGNTTTSREGLQTSPHRLQSIGTGGLSGAPLKPLALATCRRLATRKQPHQQIIAVGGISSGSDAYQFVRAGATACQLYTGLIYRGPSIVQQICCQLSDLLDKNGICLDEAIGADLK